MAFAALRCPPELLLRPLIRKALRPNVARPVLNLTRGMRSWYRVATCEAYDKPLIIKKNPKLETLGLGEVRIEVHSAGVNFADILTCKGKYQAVSAPPFAPGHEIAGEVTEVASDVTTFKKGDRVFGVCPGGGFSDETITAPETLWHMPHYVTFVQAAALPMSYGTAMIALNQKAHIKPGETVLITAAAGAIGLAAVDIAKHVFKAKVIGAAGGAKKCAMVKKKGADHVIDYTVDNLREKVQEFTDGKGVDIVFESVGGDMFIDCLKSLAWDGRIIVIGFAGGTIPKIPANILLLKNASALGVWWGEHMRNNPSAWRKSIDDVLDNVAAYKISPTLSGTFPLEEINEAFDSVSSRKSIGKVVISFVH